jgi:Flp pilus assembly CpaE family ATPase
MAKPGIHMHCVAMIDGAVEPETEARLMSAGVSSVLPVPPLAAAAPMVAQMPDCRLHLSDPPVARHDSQIGAAPVAAVQSTAAVAPELPATGATGKLTAVLRARGGAGASTVAVNLGLSCAAAGGSIVLVDLDVQNGSVGVLLDVVDSADMTTLLRNGALPDAGFLDSALARHSSGLDVLAAPDTFVPLTALSAEMVAAFMDHLQARYDHVIVDMPQSMIDWVEPLFERASLALIVTDTSVPSIKRTRRLIDVLGEEHMTLAVQVVINKEKRPLMLSESQKEAARLLGRRLEHWIPADDRAARRALDCGVPVLMGAPRSGPARAIDALGKTLFSPRSKGAE